MRIRNDILARSFYRFNAFVYMLYADRQKVRKYDRQGIHGTDQERSKGNQVTSGTDSS